MFANDTYQQFTSHTFSLQCYSTSTRIGIFAILHLRSVFSKYPHSIHDISAHCPYFPLSSNSILLSSSFYILILLLLSPSISYLLLLCTRSFIFYYVLCLVLRDCYGVVTSYTISYDDLWHTCFGCNAAIAYLYECRDPLSFDMVSSLTRD